MPDNRRTTRTNPQKLPPSTIIDAVHYAKAYWEFTVEQKIALGYDVEFANNQAAKWSAIAKEIDP